MLKSQNEGKITRGFENPEAQIQRLSTSLIIIAKWLGKTLEIKFLNILFGTPPSYSLLKINFDASVTSNNITLTTVCCNHISEIISLSYGHSQLTQVNP